MIDFEKDQVEVIDKTKNVNKLADKIKEMQALQQQLQIQEESVKLKVEPMTLKALVRERIEAGKELPTELFGVYTENKTTVKRKQ
jgi:hypothetical protein